MKTKILIAKIAIWLLALRPLAYLTLGIINEDLGANPVETLEHTTGTWALIFLMLSLSMTPIRLITKQAWVIQLRRLLGLWMFAYASLHVVSYIWLDFGFLWDEIWLDIIEHPRIWLGLLAFLLAIPLTVTSNSYMMKRLKTKWKTLHKLVYPLAILAVLHFLWLVKKDLTEPLYYVVILSILFGIRLYHQFKKPAP